MEHVTPWWEAYQLDWDKKGNTMTHSNETKHTPTPWVVIDGGKRIAVEVGDPKYATRMYAGICDVLSRGTPEEATANRNANAAFIVRAVNCHDELVARLEQAIEYIQRPGAVKAMGFEKYSSFMVQQAMQTLAKARGKA